MMRGLLLVPLVALALLGACRSQIGDPCSSSVDCERGQLCDTTLPGGYCTRARCTFSGCPNEAVCAEFTDFDSFCMKRCGGEGDCREGYACIREIAPAAFCGVLSEGEIP